MISPMHVQQNSNSILSEATGTPETQPILLIISGRITKTGHCKDGSAVCSQSLSGRAVVSL